MDRVSEAILLELNPSSIYYKLCDLVCHLTSLCLMSLAGKCEYYFQCIGDALLVKTE